MATVKDFYTEDGYDYYKMALEIINSGADESENRMPVEDWLQYGDIDDSDNIADLAAQYNEEHETWRN